MSVQASHRSLCKRTTIKRGREGLVSSPITERIRNMTPEEKTKPVNELFDQAFKNYEQALKTGLKLQEESGKWWTQLFSQCPPTPDWQKKVKSLSDDLIPQTQKSVDAGLKLMEQNSRASVELLKKAVAAAQSTSPQDAQAKFLGFVESSLSAVRDTAQAVTQANTRVIESWMEYVGKATEPATEAKAARA